MNPYRVIEIEPNGRLANQMFQFMVAHSLAAAFGGAKIFGYRMTEWDLVSSDQSPPPPSGLAHKIVLEGHRFNLRRLSSLLSNHTDFHIKLEGWGCRMEYINRRREQMIQTFRSNGMPDGKGRSNEELVIHVRAEDILNGSHPDYLPTPINLIKHVVMKTKLRPVFIGQIGENWYCDLLKASFPNAVFVAPASVIQDFQTLRASKNILMSTSTFCWLAAWLSTTNQSIHMPLLGLFNPRQRPDVDLMPVGDSRYQYYGFAPCRWNGQPNLIENMPFTEVSAGATRSIRLIAHGRNWLSDTKNSVRRLLG